MIEARARRSSAVLNEADIGQYGTFHPPSTETFSIAFARHVCRRALVACAVFAGGMRPGQ
jgi:hypothetical protein